ncbi:MAG: GAF domain-containing protein [Anaerolineae bacterium]|nr:GAF domain-containing protein [Anaerolineae bacterium]
MPRFQWLASLSRQHTPEHDAAHLLTEIGEQVAQRLFARLDLDELLHDITTTLEKRFEMVYHVQLYLLDTNGQQAVLRASTGAVGQQLLTQEYAVDVGSLSVVGRVSISGEPLYIPDYRQSPIHKPQVLLPGTRSELALPLGAGKEIIGVLDFQSKRARAFSEPDIDLLSAIANQIAIAVDGLQLYEASQRSLRENRALYQQTQTNLREIERLNYQLTGRAWADYLRTQADAVAVTLNVQTGGAESTAKWTPTLNEAATHRQVITITSQGQRIVSLPIVVRNDVIGAMEFELESDAELPDGMLELVAAVGERLGSAMENRRLFDEAQRAAQREALINDVGAALQAATGVDAIIQRAAQHLQEALDAHQITIHIGDIVAE